MFGLAGAMVTIDMDALLSDCESFCIQDCLYALMPLLVGIMAGFRLFRMMT